MTPLTVMTKLLEMCRSKVSLFVCELEIWSRLWIWLILIDFRLGLYSPSGTSRPQQASSESVL